MDQFKRFLQIKKIKILFFPFLNYIVRIKTRIFFNCIYRVKSLSNIDKTIKNVHIPSLLVGYNYKFIKYIVI